MPVIRLEGVGHSFPAGGRVFGGLSATLHAGRVYAVTGPSGSGKSTLLGILAGWIRPAEGTVEAPEGLRVSWVPQNPHGVAARTALDHVTLPFLARGAHRADAEKDARALLAAFGLVERAAGTFATLSGGESQRLMLARGIAHRPDLLLVDEPTAQLDRRTADSVNATLAALRTPGILVVIATHDPATRDACTDHIDLADYR